MNIILEEPPSRIKRALALLIFTGMLTGSFGLGLLIKAKVKMAPLNASILELAAIQENSLLAVSNPITPTKTQKIKMVITAYSSEVQQTDSTPFVTASGDMVKDGIVANNLLPFGTKIKIPELYGNKIFEVQDRMNWRKSYYQLDVWFPKYEQAKNFGTKKEIIEILEG